VPAPLVGPKPPPRAFTPLKTTLFVLLALLLLIEGTVLLFYQLAYHPALLDVQATAVTQDFLAQQAEASATARARATATINAMTTREIYAWATRGKPVIDDPLSSIGGAPWYHYQIRQLDCNFSGGAYHLRMAAAGGAFCPDFNAGFANMALEVQVTIIKGFAGGITFRMTDTGGYLFAVSTDGGYVLNKVENNQPTHLKEGMSPAVASALNQPNTLTVIALGSHIYLYINKQPLGMVTDTGFPSGQLAFFGQGNTTPSDVAFNNIKVWGL
jgi:hypothetical protein